MKKIFIPAIAALLLTPTLTCAMAQNRFNGHASQNNSDTQGEDEDRNIQGRYL